jgi:GGDEF domain-containing protein
MAVQSTAPGRRLPEQRKARARLPLLILVALICPPLAGIRSAPVWICYVVFVLLYSLAVMRLCTQFSNDRRLGYLLCLTDLAVLLPLLVWSTSAAVQSIIVVMCVAGALITFLGIRADQRASRRNLDRTVPKKLVEKRTVDADTGAPLERAVRLRLAVFRSTGSRFALVVLRVLRFEESVAYYGEESSQRVLTAISRRSLRLLGPDAQHFVLPGGRVAFLFETASQRLPGTPGALALDRADPTDIESLAMALGRKACEHLVDGHRVECVVGWASAPSDGLNADDLMGVAEAGAQSTAAFRRVAGQVTVPERARVAAG